MAIWRFAQHCVAVGRSSIANLLIAVALLLPQALPAHADNAQYFYDPGGRLIGMIDPTNGSAQYSYDQAGNILSISRTPSTTMGVVQFFPARGPVGTSVTISGTAFTGGTTTVKFGTVTATPTSVTANTIVVPVPSGLTLPVAITISRTSPAGQITTSALFTVAPPPAAPTITSFTPTKQIQGGTVTISGTNFDTANSKVYVNGQAARITASTATSLTIEVPPASSGKITVQTPAGKIDSSADLIVARPPLTAASIFASARGTLGGSPTTINLGASGTASLVLVTPVAGHRISAYVDNGGSVCTSGVLPGSFLLPSGVSAGDKNYCFYDPWYRSPVLGADTVSLELRPTAAGSATVKFYDLPPDPTTTLTLATLTTLTTTVRGQQAIFNFAGTAAQKMAIWVDATGISSAPYSPSATFVLQNPDGTVLAQGTLSKDFATQQLVTLAETGTHKLIVSPLPGYPDTTGTGVGPVQVAVFNSSDVFQAIPVNGTLTTLTIANPGQNYVGTFTGTANQRINIRTDATHMVLPVMPVLTGPSGQISGNVGTDTVMWMQDDLNPNTNRITLPVAGLYQLRIVPTVHSPFGWDVPSITNGTGTYDVTVFDVPPDVNGGAFTIGGAQKTVTFTVPGQDAAFTVNATTAGQKIKFTFDLTGMFGSGTLNTPCGTLKINNGATPNSITLCGTTYTTSPVTLPIIGTYNIGWAPAIGYADPAYGTGTAKINVTASP